MNRVVLSSVIALIIIASVAVGVYFYQRYSIILTDPMKAVPGDAAFIIETKNAKKSAEKLLSDDWKKQFEENKWYAAFETKFHLLDSLVKKNNSVKDIWTSQPVVISAHVTRANSFDFLFLTNAPRGWTEQKISNFLKDDCGIGDGLSRREYESVNIYETTLGTSPFTFALHEGVFVSSFTSFLVEDAIRQLKSGDGILQSRAFTKAKTETRENDELKYYINYSGLRDFMSVFAAGGNEKFLNKVRSFGGWSAATIDVQPNIISLKGYSASGDTNSFTVIFRNQKPKKISITDIAPARTAMILSYGFSDFNEFRSHLYCNAVYASSIEERKQNIIPIEKKYKLSFEKDFLSWISDEAALLVTEPGGVNFANSSYALIRAKNVDEAKNLLQHAQGLINKNSNATNEKEVYHNFTLSYINLNGIVPLMLGNYFNCISKFYYTSYNDYIVIANQASVLRSFIDDMQDKRFLKASKGFQSLQKSINPSSNIFLYFNSMRGQNILKSVASNQFLQILDEHQSPVNNASDIAMQWMNEKDVMKSEMFFQYDKTVMHGISLLWQAQLDTSVSMTPAVVEDELHQKFIIVQDDKNTLYEIDESGNTVWQKGLPEKILSSIHIVDYYHNQSRQILFNTAHQLYLYDMDGNNTANYPIRLAAAATNGCAVFDFNNSKTTNIFIACSNNIIYGYELNGKPLSDWHYVIAKNVTKPLQLFTSGNKNFILISENGGNTFLIDRRTEDKIVFNPFNAGINTTFNFVKGDSSHYDYIAATDTSGRICELFIGANGEVKYVQPPANVSLSHAFIRADVNGDGKQDEVFLDENKLTAYKADGSVIYKHVFTENIFPQIYKYSLSGITENIFVTSVTANKIFMMNKDGTVMQSFPIKGSTIPVIDKLNEENKMLIAGSNDYNLYVYKID